MQLGLLFMSGCTCNPSQSLNQLQLEHLDGLWGCRKLTLISSLSSSTCKTHTSHQSSLYAHDTKSISSSTRSPSSIVTLSILLKCLKRNKISKAGSCSKSFHCSTNSITNPFSNGGSREMPLSSYTKVFLMLTQVDEILPILIVYCCSIRNLFLFAQKCTLSQVVNEISLKELVDSHCIMMKRVTYYDIIDGAAHQHSCNKWVYGCLWIIPVELGCIVQHGRIILGNVSYDQRFSYSCKSYFNSVSKQDCCLAMTEWGRRTSSFSHRESTK